MTSFGKHSCKPDGLRDICRECRKPDTASYNARNRDQVLAANRERHARNRPANNARSRKWYRDNRPQAIAAAGDWAKKNPDRAFVNKRRHQVKRFGLTLEEYDALLTSQSGTCAICRSRPQGIHLHVDHEHVKDFGLLPREEKRALVRGLLCYRCNNALGLFKDRADILRRAAGYLRRAST